MRAAILVAVLLLIPSAAFAGKRYTGFDNRGRSYSGWQSSSGSRGTLTDNKGQSWTWYRNGGQITIYDRKGKPTTFRESSLDDEVSRPLGPPPKAGSRPIDYYYFD